MKSSRPVIVQDESRTPPTRPVQPPPLRGWTAGRLDERRQRSVTTCTICTTRLSLDDGTHAHPHCRGAAPLTEPEMGRLVAALGDLLGARPFTPHQGPR